MIVSNITTTNRIHRCIINIKTPTSSYSNNLSHRRDEIMRIVPGGGVLPGADEFTGQPVGACSPATKAFSKLQRNKGKVGPG